MRSESGDRRERREVECIGERDDARVFHATKPLEGDRRGRDEPVASMASQDISRGQSLGSPTEHL